MSKDRFERDLLRGNLDLMILSIISGEPKYGYLIQKRLKSATDDRAGLTAGTLYPILHRMEAAGLIRSTWESESGRKRKWYQLTAKGERKLTSQAKEWEQFTQCVSNLLKSALPGGSRSPEGA